jgi:molybdopterin biosynthesis enzyme MoaB
MENDRPIRIAVLVVVKTHQLALRPHPGEVLRELFTARGFIPALYAEVEPNRKIVRGALRRWSDEGLADVIVTVGSNGIAGDDVAGDAAVSVFRRELTGVSMRLLAMLSEIEPQASIYQYAVGVRAETVIVTLPASKSLMSASCEFLAGLLPELLRSF